MKRFVLLISVICLLASMTAYSQVLDEQPINPEFLKYLQVTDYGKNLPTTEDGYSLGFMPTPFPTKKDFLPKRKLNTEKVQTPSSYDLRNVGGVSYVTSVKNQGSCGSCWAFAAAASVESTELVLGNGTKDYSEQNIKNCHGFYWGHCDGGTEEVAAAYMVRYAGPVNEADDPYNIYNGVCSTDETPRANFTQAWYLPDRRTAGYVETLKEAIMSYGGVFTAMCWSNSYYNSTTRCYNYQGTSWANHAVLVVGWDDSKDMSSVGATYPGAWIIKNSWGTSFGQSGYFYISYQDRIVNDVLLVYPQRIDYNVNANLFLYDKLGTVSGVGYGSNTGYGLVKFVPTAATQLAKLGTWVRSSGTRVIFDVYDTYSNGQLSNLLGSISQQTCDFAGYHTFDLTTAINIPAGNDFYIKVTYYSPGNSYPIPTERVITSYCYPTIETGVCWISPNGSTWTQIGTGTNTVADLCIRAYGANQQGNAITPPTLASPVNNATDVQLNAILDWNPVTNATGYDLQVSTNSTFSTTIVNQTNIIPTEYNVPANTLQYSTTYYWRVRTKCSTETSTWTSRQFTTLSNIVPPSIAVPTNQATNVSLTPNLTWNNVQGATCYDIQVSRSPVFDLTLVNMANYQTTQCPVNGGILSELTSYYWRVRAKNGTQTSGWSNAEFMTGEIPDPTSLVSPANNATNIVLYATLDWTDVTGATGYDLQISELADFSTQVLSNQNITTSQYTLNSTTLDNSTLYYWRVRTRNGDNVSTWVSRQFTTVTAPDPPTLSSPYSMQRSVSLTPLFDWTDVNGAEAYTIQISTNSTFSNIIFEEADITASQYSLPSGYLNYYTYYYWRVRTHIGSYVSTWSAVKYFQTLSLPAPTMSAPAYYASNVAVTPTFQWSDVTGATEYCLQVSTNSTFSTFVIDKTGLTASEYVTPSNTLSNGVTYYWRVKVKSGSIESSWSYRWLFSTIANSGPTLVSPNDLATGVALRPSLDWNDVSGCDAYEIQVANNNYFSSPVVNLNNLTVSNYSITADLNENTTYYWRIRSRQGTSYSAWSSRSFTTVELNPGPTLVAPTNYATGISVSPTLDWADVPNIQNYQVQVSTSSSFSTTIIDQTNITSSQFTVPNDVLGYSTYYYWRVRYVNGSVTSNWSSVWRLRTKTVPTSYPTSPSYRQTGVSLTPTLTWSNVSEADSYNVQISVTSNFSNYTLNEENLSSNSLTIPTGSLSPLTEYFWRVQVVANGQVSYWSTTYRFTTRSIKESAELFDPNILTVEDYDINVYPNPTADILNIDANFKKKVNFEFRLTDVMGKQLFKYDPTKVTEYHDRFYLNNLPSGMYILNLRIDGREVIRKIIKD